MVIQELSCVFYKSKSLNCIGVLTFLQLKEFELYWGAVFFKDLFKHFYEVKMG